MNYLSTPWRLLIALADATKPMPQALLRVHLDGREVVGALRELVRVGQVVYKFDPVREVRVYSITQAGLDRLAVVEAVVEVATSTKAGRVPLASIVEHTNHDIEHIRRILGSEPRLREADPNVWEVRSAGSGRPRLG